MAHRKVYSAEFKQPVQLAHQPENTNQGTLHDLGISQSALSGLIRVDRKLCSLAFSGQGVARLTPDQETIERFKRELEILRQEREVLGGQQGDRVSVPDLQSGGDGNWTTKVDLHLIEPHHQPFKPLHPFPAGSPRRTSGLRVRLASSQQERRPSGRKHEP